MSHFISCELTETLKYQTATSAVLSVISSSPTHIQPVIDTIVENVVQLGDGVSGFVYRYDDDLIHLVAHDHSVGPDALAVFRQVYPLKPSRTSVIAEAILDRAVSGCATRRSRPFLPAELRSSTSTSSARRASR